MFIQPELNFAGFFQRILKCNNKRGSFEFGTLTGYEALVGLPLLLN